jgi:hypothetical protein
MKYNEWCDPGVLAQLNLPVEIESDGVAWIEVSRSETCFHAGLGWLPHVRGQAIVGHHLGLPDALDIVERFFAAEAKVSRNEFQRFVDLLFRCGWPAGMAPWEA